MQLRTKAVLVAALAALSFPAVAAEYEIDPSHSSAEFQVRHLMVANVRGGFSGVSGKLELDEKDITKSKVTATIDAKSLNTRDEKRDEHLRSPDFFDVPNHPTLTFVSKKVHKAGKGKLKVVGDLTMRGVTKEVTLDVEGPTATVKDPWGQTKMGAVATTKVNRQDYGLKWNKALEGGGVVVGDEVKITLDLEFTHKAPAATASAGQK
jgi:polyisoprenoid-binding protein YceI